MNSTITIGDKIKDLRKEKKLTQVELAEKANISRSYLADIERNRYNPSVDTLKAIAKALDVPNSLLITEESDKFKDIQHMCMQYIFDKTNEDMFKKQYLNIINSYKNLCNKKNTENKVVKIPLVGTVRAGEPILAEDNIERYLPISSIFIDEDKEYFYLRVKGDSMDKEFSDGTLLLIEKTPCVENGAIAVVLIDDEATVKKVTLNKNMITLIPCSNNPKYIPKIYDIKKDRVSIIGRVKQAIKEY